MELSSNPQPTSQTPVVRPSVYGFIDYRAFLEEFYRFKKVTDRVFTYASFSKKAGLNSPNYYKLVKDSKRNLTTKNLRKFSSGLGLDPSESSYFETLVNYNQSTSPDEKVYYFQKLRTQIPKGINSINHLGDRLYDSFATFLILDLFALKDFTPSLEWIEAKLNFFLTKQEIRDILDSLEESKLIQRQSNQTWVALNPNPIYQRQREKAILANFHIKNIENSLNLIRTLPFNQRETLSATAAIRMEDWALMMKDITQAVVQIVDKYNQKSGADLVVQYNTQLVQMSKTVKQNSKEGVTQ